MRYLVLSDIHSNLEALQAVLEAAKGKYERVLCCGDIVGYGPDPGKVTACLQALNPMVVRGNHDKAVLGITDLEDFNPQARAAAIWTRGVLGADHFDYLRQVPPGPATMNDFTLVHGSLLDEDEYLFHATEAGPSLNLAWRPITFIGHTHWQGGFELLKDGRIGTLKPIFPPGIPVSLLSLEPETRYLINPGSVGQPRDRDPRAAFAFYDSGRHEVSYCRVEYPIEITQGKMTNVQLPAYLINRLSVGR
jgi:predicted phosphodiesterase